MMIHKKLGISGADYEDLYLEKYLRWCMSYSTLLFPEKEQPDDRMRREIMQGKNDLQMLVGNGAISKWYMMEYEKLEQKFLDDLKAYEGAVVDREDILKLYNQTTTDIFTIYPKPLFEVARKTAITNDTGRS